MSPGAPPVIALAVAASVASVVSRVEEIRLVSIETRPAIRLQLSTAPGRVTIHREGELTRVSLERTDLGPAFSAGDRFQWLRPASVTPGPDAPPLEALWIRRGDAEVSLLLRVDPEVSVQARREGAAVALLFHEPPAALAPTARIAKADAAVPAPVALAPAPAPAAAAAPEAATETATEAAVFPSAARAADLGERVEPAPVAPPVEAVSPSATLPLVDRPPEEGLAPLTADAGAMLLRTLAAAPAGEATADPASAEELYRKLFPGAAPAPATTEVPVGRPEPASEGRTLQLGFLTFRPSLRFSYVDAEANVLDEASPARDRFVQLQPGLGLAASLWDGRFRADYEPAFRSFGSYDVTRSTTHRAGARIDLLVDERLRLSASDAFVSGVLETEEVDPGGEYFFDLSRFGHNTLGAKASYELAPRWSVEAGGGWSRVRFGDPGGFFGYDRRQLDAGIGFDLAPGLQATLSYVFDQVPTPDERPEARTTAHGVQLALAGDLSPLLKGQVAVGYRDQDSPLAGEGGRSFKGAVASGDLTRALGRASSVTVGLSRGTPLSAFEENAYYVSTDLRGSLVIPLPLDVSLDTGINRRANDYRTIAGGVSFPREDRIVEWRVGLRRPLGPGGSVGVGYRHRRRRSNLDRFDNTTEGLILQVEFNVFSAAGFR